MLISQPNPHPAGSVAQRTGARHRRGHPHGRQHLLKAVRSTAPLPGKAPLRPLHLARAQRLPRVRTARAQPLVERARHLRRGCRNREQEARSRRRTRRSRRGRRRRRRLQGEEARRRRQPSESRRRRRRGRKRRRTGGVLRTIPPLARMRMLYRCGRNRRRRAIGTRGDQLCGRVDGEGTDWVL